jgi:hypothetical protein
VSAYDLAGNQGSPSGRDSFGVDNTPPNAPILIAPSDTVTIRDTSVTLIWHRSQDSLSGVLNYKVQVSLDSFFVQSETTVVSDTTCRLRLPGILFYYWRVQAKDHAGNSSSWSPSRKFKLTQGIEEMSKVQIPIMFTLLQNSPNPFFHMTTIRYSLPIRTRVTVKIYNVFGNEASTIINVVQNPGWYSIGWNGRDNKGQICPCGIYFYTLKADGFATQKKMMLLK